MATTHFTRLAAGLTMACTLMAQPVDPAKADPSRQAAEPGKTAGWQETNAPGHYTVQPGTKIPLSLINSVSTKHSEEGERVYLETVFPILVNHRIVIPPGSYVAGTITQIKRPGRIKGRGEIYLRFDSLTLPNGVTRDFRGRIGSLDGRASEDFDRTEGKISSEGNKSGDARTVGEATSAGASVGTIAGAATGNWGKGLGIGAGAGAAAGLIGVLMSRGPDAVLSRGTTLEMVIDRPLEFVEEEVDFGQAPAARRIPESGPGPLPSVKTQNNGTGFPSRRF